MGENGLFRRGRWVAAAVAGVVAGGVLIGPGAATAAPPGAPAAAPPGPAAITLARPTGPYLTGTTLLHLRDQRRVDPLDPQHRKRELMVQLWYPAAAAAGKPRAPYAPPAEAAGLQAQYPVPAGAFSGPTNSRLGAPVQPGRHQVVLYSHGLCGARTDNTAAGEQLASLGYVVVALDAAHESPVVEFPGGRVEKTTEKTFCRAGGAPFTAANQAILKRLLAVRVADSRFVLDRLQQIRRVDPDVEHRALPRGLAAGLDTRRVGMFGHSFGGGTTAAVLKADRRFVAGIDLDGLVVGPVATTGLRKPFLVVGSDYHDATFDPSWATFLPRLTGWHRWLSLDHAGHYRFMDLGGSAHQWGLDQTLKKQDPGTWRQVFGDIDDALSQEVTSRLVGSFFERFLRGRPAPILTRPADFYPALRDRTGEI